MTNHSVIRLTGVTILEDGTFEIGLQRPDRSCYTVKATLQDDAELVEGDEHLIGLYLDIVD